MKTSLSKAKLEKFSDKLRSSMTDFNAVYPSESGGRQPVHVIYGGAHLFKFDTAKKLGVLATRSLETYASDVDAFAEVFELDSKIAADVFMRVKNKLATEAVEDLRIDFEDGYGTRSDEEEDGHAVAAAEEMARGFAENTLPPFCGIRVKALSQEAHRRSIRTLDIFLTTLVENTGGRLPENFVVTLPKIVSPDQIALLIEVFEELSDGLSLAQDALHMEMMIETTQSIITYDGCAAMPLFLKAAKSRCIAAHFGAYDYTASCGITAADQDMLHQACNFARNMMQVAFAGTGVRLSDGATNVIPVGPHRGENLSDEQIEENRAVVRRAWKLHYDHVRRSLSNGFYQSWDLHPAQLVSRYAAVYAFFLENQNDTAERLRNFVDKAARATMVGDIFDDAATGQGLLNFFVRAVNCRAMSEKEVMGFTSLSLEELQSASFAKIMELRAGTRNPSKP